MSWLDWLLRRPASPAASFDLDAVLAAGISDRSSAGARTTITRLNQERKILVRERHAVNAQFNRLTPGGIRRIARSSGNPEMESFQLSQAMQAANDAQSGSLRSEKLAAIDGQIRALDRAISQLQTAV